LKKNIYLKIYIFTQMELAVVKRGKVTHVSFIRDRCTAYLYPCSCEFKNHKYIKALNGWTCLLRLLSDTRKVVNNLRLRECKKATATSMRIVGHVRNSSRETPEK